MSTIILIIAAVLFVLAVVAVGVFILGKTVATPKKQENETSFETRSGESRFSLALPSGFALSCVFIPRSETVQGPHKAVILCHGFNQTKNDMYKYADLFHRADFDALIFDQRYYGESGGNFSSSGYFEKDDILALTKKVRELCGPETTVGLFGVSFGAVAAILASYEEQFDFVIADTPFSDLHRLLKEHMKSDYRIKAFPMLHLTELYLRIRYKIKVRTVSPIKLYKNKKKPNPTPIFIIHGDEDEMISPQMSVDLYNTKTGGYKKFYLASEAGFTDAYHKNPDEYESKIYQFLDRVYKK